MTGSADAAPIRMTAPFTRMPITTLPQATGADVHGAFAAARETQREWAARSVAECRRFWCGSTT
ncbi:aldehyde dehydrogenase family protein [Amycolatopsis sp. FDAARGOS 1241]|uniref:aldehyde dehydrogenase family protein n=1 Tax=Amycolatopsis sp. FDAARGOS 1241 TaxID=2778070 RepID=UPI00351C996A